MDIINRLDKIDEKIRKKDFMENKGPDNEVGYYVFDYDAEDELVVRNYLEKYIKNFNDQMNHIFIKAFDLYDIFIDYIEEEGFLDTIYEMGRRDEISNAILDQDGGYAYLVWGQEVESVGHMTEVHEKEYEKWLKDDLIYSTKSLEDAAKHYKIDEKSFMTTIDNFNKAVEAGEDKDFNKGGNMVAIKEGDFYIQKVVPSTHHTMGGITINEDAQVLDAKGEVIPNLYAAGEVVGGIHGTNRLGGNAITDIVVFGRIAGQNIVK